MPSLLVENLHHYHDVLRKSGVRVEDKIVDTLPDKDNIMVIDGRPTVCFCSSGYLGVQKQEEVTRSGAQTLYTYGNDTTMSRLVGGNLRILVELEETIAQFKHTESAITFATGLMANTGAIPALVDTDRFMYKFYGAPPPKHDPIIIGDQLNHHSIRMGVRISHAEYKRYPHNDMEQLAQLLDKNRDRPILVITDGVFSLDGDLAPLPQLVDLCEQHCATLYVDDAHGTGVLGRHGRGTIEHFNLEGRVEVQMGTLSKAFGIIGGFVAGSKQLVEMIKFSAPTYIFTSGLTAADAQSVKTAIDIVSREPQLRQQLWKNVYRTLDGLRTIGIQFPLQWSPIIPILLGSEQKAIDIEQYLLERELYCSAVRPPGVIAEDSRLRLLINANHSFVQIDHLLSVLNDAANKFELPKSPYRPEDWSEFLDQTPDYICEFIENRIH